MNLCFENVVSRMLEVIPEQIKPYNETLEWLEEPLPYVVFGQTLNPYLIELLKENCNPQKLYEIFGFLEDMANCDSEEVITLLVTSTLEYIAFDEPKVFNSSKKHAGNITLKWLNKLRE